MGPATAAVWPPAAAGAGRLSRLRFHDLRHTFATLALQEGVPVKPVSAMPGHATIAIMPDLHAHATERMEEQAFTFVNDLFET
jgi:integrase